MYCLLNIACTVSAEILHAAADMPCNFCKIIQLWTGHTLNASHNWPSDEIFSRCLWL